MHPYGRYAQAVRNDYAMHGRSSDEVASQHRRQVPQPPVHEGMEDGYLNVMPAFGWSAHLVKSLTVVRLPKVARVENTALITRLLTHKALGPVAGPLHDVPWAASRTAWTILTPGHIVAGLTLARTAYWPIPDPMRTHGGRHAPCLFGAFFENLFVVQAPNEQSLHRFPLCKVRHHAQQLWQVVLAVWTPPHVTP
eukprot:1814455-Prymnesium_polylepis.1